MSVIYNPEIKSGYLKETSIVLVRVGVLSPPCPLVGILSAKISRDWIATKKYLPRAIIKDFCSKKQHRIKSTNKKPNAQWCHFLVVIHSGGRKLNAKVIVSCAVWAEEKAASSKTERLEVAAGGGSSTLGVRQCRAADKILKGRCGCSNGLINSRKFPLNPVCWGSE